MEAGCVFAQDVDEFVVDDLYDLLGGRERGRDFFAEGAGADVLDELVDDGEVDVGLEEGEADLAEGVGDVLVGDGALAAEGLEGTLEFVAEVFKHDCLEFISGARKENGACFRAMPTSQNRDMGHQNLWWREMPVADLVLG